MTNNNQVHCKLISKLSDGSVLIFSQGCFDMWCIFHLVNNRKHAIKDVEIFSKIKRYANSEYRFKLYRDFVSVFNLVSNDVDCDVVEKIKRISTAYKKPEEIEYVLMFLYAGMVAEENKQNAILKKYVKRLGVHQVLIEDQCPILAANYSRGKKWRELKLECEARGFYSNNDSMPLSA